MFGMDAAVAQKSNAPPKNTSAMIPLVCFFTLKKQNFLVISLPIDFYSNFKSPVILSIRFSGAGPKEIQVVVPGGS